MLSVLKNPCYLQRFARSLADSGVFGVPRLIDYFVRFWFGCWFPHTVRVGPGSTLGYGGLGCVIHSDAVLGSNVHIGAGVLIGASGRIPGVPEIGDGVYVGFGAVIAGPVKIGSGAVIGANSVVLRDVPPNCVVAGAPARILRRDISASEYPFLGIDPVRK